MLFTLQYKVKGGQWINHPEVQPSSDHQSLAIIAQDMAKNNIGTATRVHSPAKAN